ncbi:MAG: hypothetical protein QXT85_00705 [Nanopusillaceae archaeon]
MIMSWLLQPETKTIIDIIANNEEFSERLIKKQTKIKENEIRKVLYKLEDLGIVVPLGTIILKDGKYDFKWKTKIKSIDEIYKILVENEIKNIDKILETLPDRIYFCVNCKAIYDFDLAFENNFHCRECGELLIEKENHKKEEIIELKKRLLELLEEVSKIKKIKAKQ